MRRGLIYSGAALGLLAGWLWFQRQSQPNPSASVFVTSRPPEPAPMCPWREPEADLRLLFPEATRHETETRILSGRRAELSRALGRAPAADELALYLHRVFRENRLVGTVLTRRVKGEFGAIELVLGVAPNGQVRGLRFQRLREPASIGAALNRSEWLAAFAGKTAASRWQLGEDIPVVEPEAVFSARAVVEGVRALLVRVAAAEQVSHAQQGTARPAPH